MKTIVTSLFLLLVMIRVSTGQTDPKAGARLSHAQNKATPCNNGTAQTDLDIGNVRATILTDGDMWWDLSNPKYEIPKNSGKMSLFNGAIWFGGVDAGSQVYVAGQTYRQTGNDFWPGPLDTVNASTDAVICNQYDRHWNVTRAAVLNFVQNGVTTPDILSWPGNGDLPLNQGQYLAPFFDVNGDGIYNPAVGDYPYYDLQNTGTNCQHILHGDQTLWWVFNDEGSVHSETGSAAIGLEIRAQAFAYNSQSANISNATLYEYQVINRSGTSYHDCYFGQWTDPDLGNASDDYVGCDVGRGMGYCYNGDMDDDGPYGYGLNPPAIGMDFLQGPLADLSDGIDNNHNGTTDEPGEDITMSKFVYYNNTNTTPNGNPNGYDDFYKYLRGVWLDGLPMTYGSDGRNAAAPPCNYMFPDSSDNLFFSTLGPWTEITAGNPPDDKRFLMSAGAFTMLPGEVNFVTIGVPWARTVSGGPLQSVQLLKEADDELQVLYNNCFIPLGTEDIDSNPFSVIVGPLPFHDQLFISFNNKNSESFTFRLYDSRGSMILESNAVSGTSQTLTRSHIRDGMYILTMRGKKGVVYTKKVVVL